MFIFYLELALVGERLFASAFWVFGVLEVFGVVWFDGNVANVSLFGTDEIDKLADLENLITYILKKIMHLFSCKCLIIISCVRGFFVEALQNASDFFISQSNRLTDSSIKMFISPLSGLSSITFWAGSLLIFSTTTLTSNVFLAESSELNL